MMSIIKSLLRPFWHQINGLPIVADNEISADQLRKYIDKPNPVIVEIGANDGSHTMWFRDLFPNGIIHCFEPDNRAAERFRERVGETENIFLHRCAVSNVSGNLAFYPSHNRKEGNTSSTWDASGSIKKPSGHLEIHPEIEFGEPCVIQSIRLDDWCQEKKVDLIDFIWMDVQGAELEVFAGAQHALSRTRFLYTEYAVMELYEGQPTLRDILRTLSDFQPVVRFLNDILLVNSKFDLDQDEPR